VIRWKFAKTFKVLLLCNMHIHDNLLLRMAWETALHIHCMNNPGKYTSLGHQTLISTFLGHVHVLICPIVHRVLES
jgi:hypothetical protein